MKSRRVWVSSLVACLILILAVLIGTSPSFEKCEHERKDHHAYRALHEESTLFVKAIVRLFLHGACTRQTASENDGAIAGLSGIAVALFTLALWISTEKLWTVASRQSADAKRSMEIAESAYAANERAWLSIEITKWSDISYYRMGGASFEVTCTIKNFGKTPAINAHTYVELLMSFPDSTVNAVRTTASQHRTVDFNNSRIVLPGQSYQREWNCSSDGSDVGHEGKVFSPLVVVCITYQAFPDMKLHQTAACYYVSKGNPGNGIMTGLLRIGEAAASSTIVMTLAAGSFAD